ncbi:hypothetical protein FHT00_000291 [Sphingomonas insulae]|uniref:Uncharacterized protein n=1 Tax=Sphingomonas insulae TaxID=424800 RepID=A0ABN1HVI2_9SPHN|nr:hypothetical protein [Sphingomonas insulae]NIJ28363.1 hypothetical protein [Sphingomonas insulae]
MTRAILLAAALALPLAACDRAGDGTSVSINADGGNTVGSIDGKSGEVKVDVPGFSGQFKLPKIQLDATDFDLNGVRLYPGSTIDTVNMATAGKDGGLRLAFTSPGSADQVRTWFQERLGKAGFTIRQDGQGLTGTTEDDKPFRLELTGDGSTKAKGTIVLGS